MMGTLRLVEGILSAINNMNTEKANSIVNPRFTFSPESGFIQKLSKVKMDNMMQGMMIL